MSPFMYLAKLGSFHMQDLARCRASRIRNHLWHGYWATLKRFVKEAHKKDIWVMVDVVANHMGPLHNEVSQPIIPTDFSVYTPFNDTFCNINNWDNQTDVEQCALGSAELPLPDLNGRCCDAEQLDPQSRQGI
ncbi:hypothetical protein BC938DRAFT_479269 [Jimgerdemannia flammicorona]|uniref:Uncharacterized protein n=1 Tax=Jimgerdemannia flammicorona TaxID=994334 RepID=A0A433QL87_9FUNG|nr:hypothetical protein BC938DRAFT_479269 [Jimgerdemannia flammicorona]